MKQWTENLCAGGEIWWSHPDDAACRIMANCHADIEQLARHEERIRGLLKAEFPPAEFRIVRVKHG